MSEQLRLLLGPLLLFVLFGWSSLHLWKYFYQHIQKDAAIDQNLSEIDRTEAPNMYWGQYAGYFVLMVLSVAVAAGALFQIARRLLFVD